MYPLSFLRSGYYSGGLSAQASYGIYWSSRCNGATNAYRLGFNSASLYPQFSSNRSAGHSLRCLAR